MSSDKNQYRLPTNVKPLHYDLTIKTDLQKLEYRGFVKIRLEVKEETSTITLNCADFELGQAAVFSHQQGTEQKPIEQTVEKDQQRVHYKLEQPLPAGSEADLKIHFHNQLPDGVKGYHRSAYEDGGEKKFNAVTEFAPTHTRTTFPCWDEPALKATFGITLISRADTINLSNMAPSSEEILSASYAAGDKDLTQLVQPLESEFSNWKVTKFQNTPLSSTYVLAWTNGHWEHLETSVELPVSGRTIPLRIFATKDNIGQAQFTLDVKKAALPLYEKVFDVPYPLPKLDTLVASHFNIGGAMENWGMIFGHTTALLVDSVKGDLATKQKVAMVECHETAHQWFGNITTTEWWTYLYLNEGFATLMGEVVVLDKVFPEWKLDSRFIPRHLEKALSMDAKLSSHPIEVDVPDANSVMEIFDALAYSKAGSVLRMLLNFVGEDVFLKGVSIYLKEHLYGSATTQDLWKGIATATGKDIAGLMTNWIEKVGFPVLTVTEVPEGIKVRQDRFMDTGLAGDKDNETIWNVPLNILSVTDDGKANVDTSVLLTEREQVFKIDTSKPYKLNAGTTGFYRVLYTPEHLSKLAKEAAKPAEQSILSVNDRVGLVYDAIALSQAGLAPISSALTFMEGLKGETENLVLSGVAESLSSFVSIWGENAEMVEHLNAFRRELFVPVVERLGYENGLDEHPDIVSLRTTAITQAAQANDPAVVKELQSRFATFLETGDESNIPSDLRRITFATAIVHGGEKEYQAMVDIQEKPMDSTYRVAATLAMASTNDSGLLERNYDRIMHKVRDQDVAYYFLGLWNNIAGRRSMAQFFMDNYEALDKRFDGSFVWTYMVEKSMSNLASEEDSKKLQNFFKDKDTAKINMTLAQVYDNIRSRAACVERSSDDMLAWFKGRSAATV